MPRPTTLPRPLTLVRIGVVSHDILLNAPRGYCIVEATFQDEETKTQFVVQGEKNPYTKGCFKWGEIDPDTKLQVHAFKATDKLTALAEALKSLFDALVVEVDRRQNATSSD